MPTAETGAGEAHRGIALPGGAAIRGLGEKFAVDLVAGTGSMTVPIPASPGRAGFGPELSLSYDSGSGNGPFGVGWSLSVPCITRDTDHSPSRYDDAGESDVYVFAGAGQLVPVLQSDGSRHRDDISVPGFAIHRYRPRVEKHFARIERWTERATGEIHWRSITRENVTTLYGRDNGSRVFDPADPVPAHPPRIYSWLICTSYDDKGNAIVYDYAAEDAAGVDRAPANERSRTCTANRYLKRVKYGNRISRLVQPDLSQADWLFELVFDYDEAHYEDVALAPGPADAQHRLVRAACTAGGTRAVRPDPFSSHRAGFEVRWYRRCRRVLMFHHFAELNEKRRAELNDEPYLVRALEFDYRDLDYSRPATQDSELGHQGSTRFASFIQSITQSGFVRDDSRPVAVRNGVRYLTYRKRSLPALELEYSRAKIQPEIRHADDRSVEDFSLGLDGSAFSGGELAGEGASDLLEELLCRLCDQGLGACPHQAELGVGRERQVLRPERAQFALASGGTLPCARRGDDDLDVMTCSSITRSSITHGSITQSPARADGGINPARQVRPPPYQGPPYLGQWPRRVASDATEAVYLADMCGSGLGDLVRVRNGEVCYWPSLGDRRFGAKVSMDNAPWLDEKDEFDQRRIRLIDIAGSGRTDIIYLHRDGVRLYFNQSGNRWSEARSVGHLPGVDSLGAITTAHLLGNGAACLVWPSPERAAPVLNASPVPRAALRPLRYMQLTAGQKPHLLIKVANNFGADTQIRYASSTEFYLADQHAGKPWLVRPPFPVQVVERVTTCDRIGGTRCVSSYRYHEGHFDHVEREFRGFGMVEQQDTEEFATFAAGGALAEGTNVDRGSHVPPVLTKTWFHTGLHLDREHLSDFFAGLLDRSDTAEYYREPGSSDARAKERLLPDTLMPSGLTPEEKHEACRALQGKVLRQEVYALDAADGSCKQAKQRAATPYTVTQQNFTIEPRQSRGNNRHAVFRVDPREALSHHYERNAAEPRVTHGFSLEVDAFGNVLRSLAVAYGRRNPSTDPNLTAVDQYQQTLRRADGTQLFERRPLITYTLSSYTQNDLPLGVQAWEHHRAPLPAETRTYELTGFEPARGAERFSFDEWSRGNFSLLDSATELAHGLPADETKTQKRLARHVRTLYRKDDLSAFSPLGTVEARALPGETYRLALTPSLLAQAFARTRCGQPDEPLLPTPSDLLEGKGSDAGGYAAWDGHWWVPSGRVFFDVGANSANSSLTAAIESSTARQHFFTPRSIADAFGQTTLVEYDAYDLLVTRNTDPVGNVVAAVNDYRVLQPREVTDPNRNRTALAFDTLGRVVATAVMGKQGQPLGDSLEGVSTEPTLAELRAFSADPQARAPALLGNSTTRIVYDLERYARAGQPAFAATLARESHLVPAPNGQSKIQLSFSFSDGFGRQIQKKVRAAAGDAPQRRAPVALSGGDVRPGDLVRDAQGRVVHAVNPCRWLGSGRVVFNSKGKPVQQYEPFFSATPLFESAAELTDTGVGPVHFYDPLGRVVTTLHPNHTYEKVVFGPWQQVTFDVNDTVAPSGNQTGDPRTDPDIQGYVLEYFKTQPAHWETWYAQRIGNAMGTSEQDAARKAEAHANTPTTAHLDALGRVFNTVARNKYVRNGQDVDETCATRLELDLEGRPRVLRDAIKDGVGAQGELMVEELGRIVMRYDYDLLGNCIHQASMDAGERWVLSDALGRPIRTWDSRGFVRRMTHDELRRPVRLFVTENGAERLAEHTVYGERQGDAANHRGQIFQRFDAAGIVTHVSYDFKGNLLQERRELLPSYERAVDWQQFPAATAGTFTSSTTFDALNRPLALTSADGSVCRPKFNEANLLGQLEVRLRGAGMATAFVTNVEYDAKGERVRIDYANGATTLYEYDPLSSRLSRLKTTRRARAEALATALFRDHSVVQDVRYTYDPVGNITSIEDGALQTGVRGGQTLEPRSAFTYDAVYQLIEAQGREHAARDALCNYTQRYEYDAVGNFQALIHRADAGSWTRRYHYLEHSLLEAGKKSNRLTSTSVGSEPSSCPPAERQHAELYTQDAHGNMTSMPQLAVMVWDFKDQLQRAELKGGGAVYYVYDCAGQRVRKVIETEDGRRQAERLYLGGFELYREYAGDGVAVALEREALHVAGGEQPVALVETLTTQGGSALLGPVPLQRYQLGDHLGSTSMELDGQGGLVAYEECHPYGTTSFQAGGRAAESSLEGPVDSGEEETGLCYFGARYYASSLGRWISADPIRLLTPDAAGQADSPRTVPLGPDLDEWLNLYRSNKNNPVNWADPDGKDPISKAAAAAARALARRFVREFGKGGARLITRGVGRAALRRMAEGLPAKVEAHIFEHADEVIGKAKHTLLRADMTPEKLLGLIRETVKKGTPILSMMKENGQLAWVFEREFAEKIGEKGQRILRVVVDKSGRLVTTFPVDNAIRHVIVRGILVSGELAAFAFLTMLLESEAQAAVADTAARRKALEDSKTWFETGLEWIGPFGLLESSPIRLEPNFDEIRRRTTAAIDEATKSLERNLSREESELIGREIYNVWDESISIAGN